MNKKSKILIVSGYYFPGFKHGGIQTSISNVISNLDDHYNFDIITRNHDVDEKEIYKDILVNQWNKIGNSRVMYLDSEDVKFFNYLKILNRLDYDAIHLNSFFDPLTVMFLFGVKLRKVKLSKIVLSPRGEFGWASLKIKFLKKFIYIILFKLLNLKKYVHWHVSTNSEKEELLNILNIKNNIYIAKDLPTIVENLDKNKFIDNNFNNNELRIIFLSRISPEKNLDLILKILNKIDKKISFDIYGTIHDDKYWSLCLNLISKTSSNIKVTYKGYINNDKVVETFGRYDLFFFPSGGENYGHVIAESLSAGTPVLISKNTPWKNLQDHKLGWDIDINNEGLFIEKIKDLFQFTNLEMQQKRSFILDNISNFLVQKEDIQNNLLIYKVDK
jgi:glycosyltransferase involved in cell wall biosynthesis